MKIVFAVLAAAMISNYALAGGATSSCMTATCPAGTHAITYATKSDFYYACPTAALADYTNTVIGVVSVQLTLQGNVPNISPITGEPEVTGDTKRLLDTQRKAAGVKTFDQALAQCSLGRNKVQVLVANNPESSGSIWVSDKRSNKMFWMPKSHLDPKK